MEDIVERKADAGRLPRDKRLGLAVAVAEARTEGLDADRGLLPATLGASGTCGGFSSMILTMWSASLPLVETLAAASTGPARVRSRVSGSLR